MAMREAAIVGRIESRPKGSERMNSQTIVIPKPHTIDAMPPVAFALRQKIAASKGTAIDPPYRV